MATQEIKGTLAKLLATENLIVEHRVVETACFDVDTRILTLPIWEGLENVTYDLLVGHEVGHALFTPPSDKEHIPPEIPRSYVNVTEDARIEKLMKNKFPGLAKCFYQGYANLNDRDFFQINDVDPSDLKLIDRINLHFKIGALALIPFADEEQQYVDMVGAAETFAEAVDAAQVLYRLEKSKQQEAAKAPKAEFKVDDKEQKGEETETTGEKQAEKNDIVEDEDLQESNEPANDPAQLDVPSFEEQSGQAGGDSADEVRTDKALQEALANAANTNEDSAPIYVELDDVDLKKTIVGHEYYRDQYTAFWNQCQDDRKKYGEKPIDFTQVDSEYRKFKDSANREVNYLVKEFEMKKSAAAYKRSTVSKTGILDMKKLHTYKWSEDLFLKISNTPDGKNHGLVFYLDWSGSMHHVIKDTVEQLLSLTWFCRKVGIPFEVYSFVYDRVWEYDTSYEDAKPNTLAFDPTFRLVNLLSSQDNNQDFEISAKYLFRTVYGLTFRQVYDWETGTYTQTIPLPGFCSLGGTPLNEAIACLPTLLPQFRAKTGVEKLNVIILTDGESNCTTYWRKRTWLQDDGTMGVSINRSGLSYNSHFRNPKTGRVFEKNGSYLSVTKRLLEYVRDAQKNVNIMGFRICTTREATRLIGQTDVFHWSELDRETAKFKKDKQYILRNWGYNELYLVQSSSLSNDVELDVEEGATKGKIRTAFKKKLKGKASNKKVLSSFISQIA